MWNILGLVLSDFYIGYIANADWTLVKGRWLLMAIILVGPHLYASIATGKLFCPARGMITSIDVRSTIPLKLFRDSDAVID